VGVVLATHLDVLEVQTESGIDYVAGGIGKEQSEAMKVAGQDYDLMLIFATDGGKYLADIDLEIEDMNGNILLNTVSEGPLFLANLPVGRYKITASAQGTSPRYWRRTSHEGCLPVVWVRDELTGAFRPTAGA
jgi:hypothetical protein